MPRVKKSELDELRRAVVCGQGHRESYFDIVMVGIVGALLALVAVIVLGSTFGSF